MAAPLPATARSITGQVSTGSEDRPSTASRSGPSRQAAEPATDVPSTCQFCGASPSPTRPSLSVTRTTTLSAVVARRSAVTNGVCSGRLSRSTSTRSMVVPEPAPPPRLAGDLGDAGVALVGRYAGQPGQHHQRERRPAVGAHDRHVVGVVVDPAGLVGDRRARRQPGRDAGPVGLAAHHVLDLGRDPAEEQPPVAGRGGVDDAGVGGRLVADHPAHLRHHVRHRGHPGLLHDQVGGEVAGEHDRPAPQLAQRLRRRRPRPTCPGPGRRPRRARTAPPPPPSRSRGARRPRGRGRAPAPPSRPAPSSGWRPAPARRRPAPTTSYRPARRARPRRRHAPAT